jgi:hypothetical protein
VLNKNILYVFTSRRNVHVNIRSIFNVAPEPVTSESEILQSPNPRSSHLKKYQLYLNKPVCTKAQNINRFREELDETVKDTRCCNADCNGSTSFFSSKINQPKISRSRSSKKRKQWDTGDWQSNNVLASHPLMTRDGRCNSCN